jgi:serine/threonine protein kinase/Tol biopolymer transport system component
MLAPGVRLGGYEVVSLLGAGGMGEVYRARDTSLNRDVAIKVLPDSVAADDERLSRFTREAQALAALNHTNIAHVYGLERSDRNAAGTAFIVMELVEGEDLAERIARGPLPVDEALPIARQIAEGLEAAHDHGIVHRDLKPANIKLRPDGAVKILDFGLAKALDQGSGDRRQASGNSADSPTFTSPAMTGVGIILGTAAYMSPEQARAGTVDHRSDLWSFGCVLYEMLTGRAVFAGPTVSDTLAAILRGTPDWTFLPSEVPPAVRHLLERCLTKDRRRRLAAASEIIVALDPTNAAPRAPKTGSEEPWYRQAAVWMTIISAIAVGTVLGWVMHGAQRAAPSAPTTAIIRLEASLGDAKQLSTPPKLTQFAVSPDGQSIVFSGQPEAAQRSLYVRRLDRGDVRLLPGTDGGQSPIFSPDGAWIAFWSNNTLRKVPVDGGTAITICQTDPGRQAGPSPIGWTSAELFAGASWGDDGRIVFGSFNSGLWEVSADGGTPTALTTPDAANGEFAHRLPHVLPGGTAVLFSIVKAPIGNVGDLAVRVRGEASPRILLRDAADARYIAPGFLLFARDATLFAARFDLDGHAIVGTPVPVEEHVQQAINSNSPGLNLAAAQFSVSRTGTLVYAKGGGYPSNPARLAWVSPDGKREEWGEVMASYLAPRISPDGRYVAVSGGLPVLTLFLYDLQRGGMTRLSDTTRAVFPVWMPDGKSLIYSATSNGPQNMYRLPIDASRPAEQLTKGPLANWSAEVSADGTRLLYVETDPKTGNDIWMLPLTGDRTPQLLVRSNGDDSFPALSRDGQWLLYASNESGKYEVYIRRLTGGGRTQVSPNGGHSPAFASDDHEVIYRSAAGADTKVMSVRLTPGDPPTVGTARTLPFDAIGVGSTPVRDFDVTRDGRRFLFTTRSAAPIHAISTLTVVLNWTRALEERLPRK